MNVGAFNAKIVYSTVHLPYKGKTEQHFFEGGNFFLVVKEIRLAVVLSCHKIVKTAHVPAVKKL